MAAQAARCVTAAERLALRQQVEQTRLAASQTVRRAVDIYAQAIRRHAELVHPSRPPRGRRPDQGQPAGSSLAQLLQPLFAIEETRPIPSSTGTQPKLAAVRSIRSRELRRELEGSLVPIRRQVQAIHHQFQLARPAAADPGAGHLHLVRSPE